MGGKRSTEILKSYVFSSLPLKAENQPERFDGWSPAVETWLAGSTSGQNSSDNDITANPNASEFLKALTAARGQLLGLLQVTSSSAAEVTAAQTRYLSLLVEVSAVEQEVNKAGDGSGESPAVLRSTWIDSLLPLTAFSTDPNSSSSSSSSSTPNSKWFGSSSRKKQAAAAAAAAASQAATAAPPRSGYSYEAANTLLAVATWQVSKAGSLVMTAGGADSGPAMEAYKLYCQAAGVLDELRRRLLPGLGQGCSVSGDLSRELITALHLYALGEAQSLMLQRALALHYQGSTLAPMATDTAMLFSQAYEAIEAAARTHKLPWTFLPPLETHAEGQSNSTTDGSSSSSSSAAKNSRMAGFERVISGQLPLEWPCEALPLLQLAAYLQYQLAHCYCLASICAAETALSSNQAGQAVALAQLGTNLCEGLAELGFSQSGLIDPCSTLGARDSSRRLALQQTLETKAAMVLRRCLRENRTIYFQYVPDSPSALPWPQRSAQPELFRLPVPQGRLSGTAVQGLINATAVGSLSSFEDDGKAAAAAAAAAAVVVEPPVVDVGSGGSRVLSPRLVEQEPNSLAELAEETAAAVAAAQAAAAAASYLTPTAEASATEVDGGAGWENAAAEPSWESADSLTGQEAAAAADGGADAANVEDTALPEDLSSLELLSSSLDAPAAKIKAGGGEASGAASPVSYTLPSAKDIGSNTSTDGSSSSSAAAGGCDSRHSRRFSSSSSAVTASSSGGSESWVEEEEDGGSECSGDGGGGFGGLLMGLFGCCLAPRGASLSDDEEGESCSEEGSEDFEDAWETGSEASRCSSASKQQGWGKQKHGQWAK